MIVRNLIDQCWLFDVRLLIGADIALVKRYLRDQGVSRPKVKPLAGGTYMDVVDGDYKQHLIVLPRGWEPTIFHLGSLGHECTHAALAILHERQVPLSLDNDEPIAYLQAYLFRWCLTQLLDPEVFGVKNFLTLG